MQCCMTRLILYHKCCSHSCFSLLSPFPPSTISPKTSPGNKGTPNGLGSIYIPLPISHKDQTEGIRAREDEKSTSSLSLVLLHVIMTTTDNGIDINKNKGERVGVTWMVIQNRVYYGDGCILVLFVTSL